MIIHNNIKVSVILPFFNTEKTIERALKSIESQSYPHFECILINNNSTDRSRDVALTFAKKDCRFLVIDEKNQGVMHASNAGSAMAKGEYITRMDADDEMPPQRLEKQVMFLDKNPEYGVVSGMVQHVGHPEKTKGFQRYVDWSNSVQTYSEIANQRFIEAPVVNPSAMWRKSIALQYGMYKEGDFPEDYEMWLRWLSHGVKIHKLPEVVLKWYDSKSRLTRTHKIYSDQAFYNIKTKYLAAWLKKHNPFYPRVAVWGASKISRRRADFLTDFGIEISAYIDISGKRQLDTQIIYYKNLPESSEIFILVYMKQMETRKKIQNFLHTKGFIEGKHYLLVS